MHVAPSATTKVELYGAPPLRVVPSEQLRLQPTSNGQPPLEQVIVEDTGEGGGLGGGGLGDGGLGGGGGPGKGEGGGEGGGLGKGESGGEGGGQLPGAHVVVL